MSAEPPEPGAWLTPSPPFHISPRAESAIGTIFLDTAARCAPLGVLFGPLLLEAAQGGWFPAFPLYDWVAGLLVSPLPGTFFFF